MQNTSEVMKFDEMKWSYEIDEVFWRVRRGQRNNHLDFDGSPDTLPYFTPIFHPHNAYLMG